MRDVAEIDDLVGIGRKERPVVVAQQHRHVAAGTVGGEQVQAPVPIDVRHRYRGREISRGEAALGLEGAAAVRLTKIDTFEGDFELLPLRAHFLFGRLPQCPSDADFHMAVTDAIPAQDPAAEWRVEAIRFRRQNPGARLDERTGSLDALLDLARRDEHEGLGDAPWPPNFPKAPGEPIRAQPSRRRAKAQDAEAPPES